MAVNTATKCNLTDSSLDKNAEKARTVLLSNWTTLEKLLLAYVVAEIGFETDEKWVSISHKLESCQLEPYKLESVFEIKLPKRPSDFYRPSLCRQQYAELMNRFIVNNSQEISKSQQVDLLISKLKKERNEEVIQNLHKKLDLYDDRTKLIDRLKSARSNDDVNQAKQYKKESIETKKRIEQERSLLENMLKIAEVSTKPVMSDSPAVESKEDKSGPVDNVSLIEEGSIVNEDEVENTVESQPDNDDAAQIISDTDSVHTHNDTDSVPKENAAGVDVKIDPKFKKRCLSNWKSLMSCRQANLFKIPIIDHNYNKAVYAKTDLNTIKRRIEWKDTDLSKEKDGLTPITTDAEFNREVHRMFSNALMYNSTESSIYKNALEMYKDVEHWLSEDSKKTRQKQPTSYNPTYTKPERKKGVRRSKVSDQLESPCTSAASPSIEPLPEAEQNLAKSKRTRKTTEISESNSRNKKRGRKSKVNAADVST